MEQQYIDLINKTPSEELCNKLIELLSENKVTIEQLIEADKNKKVAITSETFNLLGISFRNAKNGVKAANNDWAIKLYEYAADKGNDSAKTNAASFYLYGYLGEPDLDKALQHCLSAKEGNQSRARLLTKIYLKKREYDAAKSAFSSFEPVKPKEYPDLLIELCEELTQDDNWGFACNVETKLTIQAINQQQKAKIIKLLERLKEKILQLKENEAELKQIIQNIVHIVSKFSHITDPEIKTICDEMLNPGDKKMYELFIGAIYDDMAQKNRANENLANSIRQNSTQTLGGAKYVNELLQNARDAGCSRVEFTLTEEYLIFRHNGKTFSLRDIQGICSYATSDRDKAEDDGSIGEKGIGFKAVFNFTEELNILFNESAFGFNRNHAKWKYSANTYPWQIIPIRAEREQILSRFPNIGDTNDVVFIFKVKTPEIRQEMATHLSALVGNNSILLFLDQLTTIKFVDETAKKNITLEKQLSDDGRSCTIKKTNQPDFKWLLFKHDYNLSPEEQGALVSKNDIAPKYRHRKNAVIQFAAPADMTAIETRSDHNTLACYFPTEIKLNLPFLVSAPFLLNSERAQLLDSAGAKYWNTLLVTEIAQAQFIWFQQLAQEKFWQHPLALMAEPATLVFPDRVPDAKAIFEKKFNEALKNAKFLRALLGNELIGISNKMDIYGFVTQFGDELTKKSCLSSAYLGKYRDKLKKLGATEFDAKCIVQQLIPARIANPDDNRALCEFFYKLNNKVVNDELKSVAFILSQTNELKKPAEICEPSDRLRYAITDIDIKLSLLHPRIDSFFRNNDHEKQEVKKRQAWLRSLGIKKLSVQEIVAAVNAAKKRETTIQFLARVAQRFQPVANEPKKTAEKREKELSQLKGLTFIVVSNGNKVITPIDRLYFDNDFEPALRLRDKLPKLPIYLSAKEFDENLSPELNSQYRTLLISLGVSEAITAKNVGRLWDSMIDDENRFIFTKLLFTIFYGEDDLERMSKFSGLVTVLKEKITFKTTAGNFVRASQCYLADRYKPEFEIEQHTNEVSFISEEYIDSPDNAENVLRWRQFLIELGVSHDVRVSKAEKEYDRNDKYFAYLWSYQGYTATGRLNGDMKDNELCPEATKRYSDQHKVNAYFKIEPIEKIIYTLIFWKIIVKKWNDIYPDCKEIVYSTQRSARRVMSNVEYLALQSLKYHYGINSLSELYAPSLQEVAMPAGLKIANVGVQLTAEQCDFFGFKTKLIAEDALKVLLYLQTQSFTDELLKKLELVYQHLATYPEDCLSGKDLSQLCLLNENNQFVPIDQLHGFLVAENDIKRYTDSAAFVKKPHKVSLQEFEKVCRILGIKTINKISLNLNPEINDEVDNSVASSLVNNITLIALLVILKEQGIDHVADEMIQAQLTYLKHKIDDLICTPANKIKVSYEDVFSQDVRAWLVHGVLYYKVSSDRITQSAICQQLLDYLNLPIDLSELAAVMFDDINAWLAERGEKIRALHQRIEAILPLVQNSKNEKKRTHSEMQDSSTSMALEKNDEQSAKRAKYSEATTTVTASAAIGEGVQNIEEEEGSEENIATLDQGDRKRTFTEAAGSEDLNEPTAKRTKLSQDLTSSATPHTYQKTFAASSSSSQSFFRSQTTAVDARSTTTQTRKNRSAAQIEADKQQGWLAEEYVFNKLKAKYSNREKYRDFTETEDGFKVTVINKNIIKHLIWHNKGGESGSHFDMTFITCDSTGTETEKQIIEVKSNAGANDQTGILGELEMAVLNEEKNYIIWHVGNMRDMGNVSDKKIKNPKQLIATGEIKKEEKREVKTILDFSSLYAAADKNEKSSQASYSPPRSGL